MTHTYSEYTDVGLCPVCGEEIDYCQGHGEIGDPIGAQILADHDAGMHVYCHPSVDCSAQPVPPAQPSASDWPRVIIGALCVVVAVLLIAATMIMLAPSSHAAWRQPYGGCKEAHSYVHSPGARACRRHGWIVKRWLVVGPRRYIHYWSPARTCARAEASDTLERGCVFPPNDPSHSPGWMTANRRTGMLTIHHARSAR